MNFARRLLLIVIATCWLVPPTFARGQELEPNDADKARYQQAVEVAVAEYAQGNWAEARALFLQAHALWPSARTFRTLGMTSFELKHYVRALEELEASLADPRRPLEADKRSEVEALLQRARAYVGRFVVDVSPSDASLELDRAPFTLPTDHVLRLSLGVHTLTARAPGHRDATTTLSVQGNEDRQLSLVLEPLPALPPVSQPTVPSDEPGAASTLAASSPVPRDASQEDSRAGGRVWSWVALGSTVAFAAGGGVLLYAADREFDDITASCDPQCEADEVDRSTYDTLLLGSRIVFAVSVLSAVTTVVLFVVEDGGDSEADLSLRVGPGGALLNARF